MRNRNSLFSYSSLYLLSESTGDCRVEITKNGNGKVE